MRHLLLLLLLLGSTVFTNAQLTVTPGRADFGTVVSGTRDSVTVIIQNAGSTDFIVTQVKLFHSQVSASENAFNVPAGQSHSLTFYIQPLHNIDYVDHALLQSSSHPDGISITLAAHVVYPGTYYDLTQNLWHEELKTALHTALGAGYTQLTYNVARDNMYMSIDNQAVNGQGASQNTVECVYTGRTATGYATRTDAQNQGFDTEHTFPQSMFSSNLPMLSDLHHIFPTWSQANNERGNKPFNYVSNPTWTDGGSKSISTQFEPRDAQKGRSARALLYFVLRYQDYTGFVAPQEAVLRTWHQNFAPNAVDIARNNAIFQVQTNRNPLVDHPEFIDRIASVCTVDSGAHYSKLHTMDTLRFGDVPGLTATDGWLPVSNEGWRKDLILSGFSFSNPAFTFITAPDSVITPDSVHRFAIRYTASVTPGTESGTLTFSTNDPTHPTASVFLSGNSGVVGNAAPVSTFLKVSPNPVSSVLRMFPSGSEPVSVTLRNLDGAAIIQTVVRGNTEIGMETLPAGMYLLEWRTNTAAGSLKIQRIR